MSRLVARNVPKDELPPAGACASSGRCRCCAASRSTRTLKGGEGAPYEFTFSNCATAMEAHRTRLPKLVEVVKAIAVAELEARGGYVEAHHDAFFERYDEHSLTADDLAQFPDYLVCIPSDRNAAPENAALMEMLWAGMR